MVSSSMMLPVYPSPSISSSEASWKHNKKFAKELSIEEEDHQLRSWFLHRRCSCALLRYMHGKNGAYTVGDFITGRQHLRVIDDDWNLVGLVSDYDLVALDSISDGEGGGW
ncbi:hypothetical protein YC2023_110370 [Brassica napus]